VKNKPEISLVALVHLYPPVMRKRRWRYMLDESLLANEMPIHKFTGCFFDFFLVNLLLVQSH